MTIDEIPQPQTAEAPLTNIESTQSPAHEHRLRRWAGRGALCFLGFVGGSLVGGLASTETDTHTLVAGIPANVEIKPGAEINSADLGLFGLQMPSKIKVFGQKFGARISLDSSTSDKDGGSTPSEDVIAQILRLFSDPQHDIDNISSDTISHSMDYAMWGGSFGLIASLATIGASVERKKALQRLGPEHMKAHSEAFSPLKTKVKVGLAITSLLASGFVFSSDTMSTEAQDGQIVANPVFDGTPLEGAQITGVAAPLIESFGSMIKENITENDKYYTALSDNFDETFNNYALTHELPKGKNIVPILVVSDRHCNVGMDRIIESAATKFGANINIRAGDDVFSGTFPFESACTSGLDDRLKQDQIKRYSVLGNHDGMETMNQQLKDGTNVLDGDIITEATDNGKVSVLGSPDPRRSIYGIPIQPNSSTDQQNLLTEQGIKLGETACNEGKHVILVTHDKRAAKVAMENGCGYVDLAISGHNHIPDGPNEFINLDGSTSYQFTEGTTGGAANSPAYGPLEADATMTLVYYDTKLKKPLGLVRLIFHVDKTVEIFDYFPMAKPLYLVQRQYPKQESLKSENTPEDKNASQLVVVR